MNIRLHIERLVLDGLPLSRHQGSLVHAAVERELGRLLSAGPQIEWSDAVPVLDGGTIQGVKGASPTHLGGQIARAVHSAIGSRK